MDTGEYAKALHESLSKADLVPGAAVSLIGQDFTPTTKLDISFGTKQVALGNFFRTGECKQQPDISFAREKDGSTASYALILTDPDAPTPDDPKFAFWRHWVLAGLQPSTAGNAQITADNALTAYLGPGPKDDSKPHRYLFLLYRAPGGWHPSKDDVGGEEFVQRRSFKPAGFAKAHGLQLVAVNWMTCAGDGWNG